MSWVCPDCDQTFQGRGRHLVKHGKQAVWNKGSNLGTPDYFVRGHTLEARARISQASREHWLDPAYREKNIAHRPKHPNWSEWTRREAAERMHLRRAGNPPWNKGVSMVGAFKNRVVTERVIEGRKRAAEKKRLYRGPLASNWQGGKSLEEYGVAWTAMLRGTIRKRDEFTCQDCGLAEKTLSGFSRVLDVHHLDMNKLNGEQDNLLTLCRSCHTKRHGFSRKEDQV